MLNLALNRQKADGQNQECFKESESGRQKNKKIWETRRELTSMTNMLLWGLGAKSPGCNGVSIIFYLEEKCVMFILSQDK